MAEGPKHIIRRASLEVQAGSRVADAAGGVFRFQQEAVSWAQDTLLPALATLFADLPPTEAHIVVDRLEIQVDARDLQRWGREVLPRLQEELRAVLVRKLREEGDVRGEQRQPAAESFYRKLAFYLEHGVLPWNLIAASSSDLAAQIKAWLVTEEAPRFAADLAVLWRLPSARIRLLQSLPAPLVALLLVRFYRMPEYLVAAWSRDASLLAPVPWQPARISDHPTVTPYLPRLLQEEILQALSHSPRLFEHGLEEDIIASYLDRVMEEGEITPQDLQLIPFESVAFLDSQQRLQRTSSSGRPQGPPSKPLAPSVPIAPAASPAPEDYAPAEIPSQRPRDRENPAQEGIHIPNAGLILLAPFLSMLFERVDLSAQAELKDPATALALLHFLATGEEDPAEFQLPLGKVLCGLSLEKAISLPMTLPENIKAEGRQLIESVIGHWGILKNTSVAGLRESFLQRPGKLSLTARNDWLLQVEQKSYDMLLRNLPWSFNLIKLPWMTKVLRTEWVE